MKAAFKWRLQNGIYGYLTDETGSGDPFAYDVAEESRIYSGGTIITGSTVVESSISTAVSRMLKEEYTAAFEKFKALVRERYPQVTLLDVIYYYNIENDECTASATALKCSATDIIFSATAVSGDTLSVTVDNEQPRPDEGEVLKYRLDFVFPVEGGGGSVVYTSVTSNDIIATSITVNELNVTEFNTTNINTENITSTTIATSAITTSSFTSQTINSTSITADTIVKNGGTDYQYLMADGSVTILSAGTNVTIDTALTTDGKVITINSTGGGGGDTNTWRPVNVNGTQILDSGINTNALTLSADTNVTLTHAGNGVVKIGATDTNTWRSIKVNNTEILGNGITSGSLTLSADTNITLTNAGNGVVKIKADDTTYSEGRNVTIDSNNKINAEGYTYTSGTTPSFAITGSTAIGKYSFAEGSGTTAYGDASHAEGSCGLYAAGAVSETPHIVNSTYPDGTETGEFTIDIGNTNLSEYKSKVVKINDTYYFVINAFIDTSYGNRLLVNKSVHSDDIKNNTIYFVSGSTALGESSHSENAGVAFGYASHASGVNTVAIGNSSHVSGIGTIATGSGQTVVGKYYFIDSEPLFIVGNGTDEEHRSNAFEVYDFNTYGVTGIVDSVHSPGIEFYYLAFSQQGLVINKKSHIVRTVTYNGVTYQNCYVYIFYGNNVVNDMNIMISANTFSADDYVCIINRTDLLNHSGLGGNLNIHHDTSNYRNLTACQFSIYKIKPNGYSSSVSVQKYALGPTSRIQISNFDYPLEHVGIEQCETLRKLVK